MEIGSKIFVLPAQYECCTEIQAKEGLCEL